MKEHEMENFLKGLEGFKSYGIGAGVIGVVAGAYFGIIGPDTAENLLVMLGAGGFITFSAKVNRGIKALNGGE
jgi:hypothetical protein